MQFAKAGVVDVLRGAQRDEVFVRQTQDVIQSVLKVFTGRNYHSFQRIVPALTNGWYYCMTSLGNLQTLGEEYTGTLRFDHSNRIPSKKIQLLWLILYLGGEHIYDRLINTLQRQISNSSELTQEARTTLLKILNFLQKYKQNFKRLHHSIFYISGQYYNISNRLIGLKYVLVREWLRDDTFTHSFRLLGQISFVYILYNLFQQFLGQENGDVIEHTPLSGELSKKTCALCAEYRKNPSVTPCGHIFCWDCIYDSLTYQKYCPMCREIIHPSRIVLLQNFI